MTTLTTLLLLMQMPSLNVHKMIAKAHVTMKRKYITKHNNNVHQQQHAAQQLNHKKQKINTFCIDLHIRSERWCSEALLSSWCILYHK